MVRFDFERAVTSRYDLKEIAAAIAAYIYRSARESSENEFSSTFPWTTACSPKTMTLPGAETMNAGIIGVDALRSSFPREAFFEDLCVPLILIFATFSSRASTLECVAAVGEFDMLEEGV